MTLNGPNSDSHNFFDKVQNIICNESSDYDAICCDFNIVLNLHMDTLNYKRTNNPNARQNILNMMNDLNLCDIERELHPPTRHW